MSTRPKYQQEITSRINDYSKGIVFSAADFMDVADTDAINKTLSRLSEEGRIRRVVQGLYDVPEYSNLLQEYAVPRPDMVAEALARKFNWTIAPCGDTALAADGASARSIRHARDPEPALSADRSVRQR